MALLITEIGGLHLLHWILSGLLPLILAAMTAAYLIINRKLIQRAKQLIDPLIRQIDELEGRSIEHLSSINTLFQRCRSKAFGRAFNRMLNECRELYQGRWLPDPAKSLRPDIILSPLQQNSISLRPAARILAIAILGALVSLLLQNQIPVQQAEMALSLILLPLLVGLAGSLLVAANASRSGKMIQFRLEDLYHSLENRVPVFNDQAGLALLIDNFLVYDREMKDALANFNDTTSRLAESDMADGIRRSVEQVLLDHVAPSIQQSTAVLGNLATELTNRQERGMQDLAARFATALSSELAAHLQPVNKEISQMGALMVDVKNYIEYAMRALETVRQQSEGLLGDTRESIRQMTDARMAMTDDFGRVDTQLQSLAASSEKMASLYQGNEQNLVQNLQTLGHQLDQYSERLGSLVHESIQALQDAQKTTESLDESAGTHLAAMQGQIEQLHSQLGDDIQAMLAQVNAETSAVASQAGTIGQQLASINTTLDRSLNDFTQGSAQYVQQTLASFDRGLAELVNRMATTAAEIRDAVDALPSALRQGQGARFDG